MGLSNDERGWVMTCLSGIACVLGASVICIDILVRQFPGQRNFRIQDSDTFLSASLSLSFGVMLFSALYNMLPSAKKSLIDGGFSPKHAAWTLIACFLGGVVGIQIISRVLHHFIPSHVVDCEHTHEEPKADAEDHDHSEEHEHPPTPKTPRRSSLPGHIIRPSTGERPSSRRSSYFSSVPPSASYAPTAETVANSQLLSVEPPSGRRPSLQQRVTNTITQLASGKRSTCDCDGPCYGYSDPCGQECFKNIKARGGFRVPTRMMSSTMKPPLVKSASTMSMRPATEATPLLGDIAEEPRPQTEHVGQEPTRYFTVREQPEEGQAEDSSGSETIDATCNGKANLQKTQSNDTSSSHRADVHHHHVPTNAFLSIGLQTSIAIALHKLPEGFITYATNHANPKLGVFVFLALFIHNITEGFAMALPLYLAINSRVKAMLISFVLGGLSQPIGAGVAAIWFKLAGQGDWAPSEGVYGGMFAVTAGIMASVALQLFSESLDLTHNRMLCMVGAFTGMGILGISSALTA